MEQRGWEKMLTRNGCKDGDEVEEERKGLSAVMLKPRKIVCVCVHTHRYTDCVCVLKWKTVLVSSPITDHPVFETVSHRT